MHRVPAFLAKFFESCQTKLRDRSLLIGLAAFFALILALVLVLVLALKPASKRAEPAGLEANKLYLDNLILPSMNPPEWYYPYENPVDFRYSEKELERLLPAASPDLIAELEQKRKAKIDAILKK